MLLLVMALVAAASMIAFGFVATARSNRVAGEHLLRAELARSAARMGARHAVEVAMGELANTYSTGEWSLKHLGHLDRDNAANNSPYPTTLDESDNLAPYNDTDDNVRAESALYNLHHYWYGDQGAGQAYRSGGGNWPWGDLPDRNCSFLNPCIPRWIEPGYYNTDGFAKPVRFTTVPVAAPERNQPMYFDQRWHPVANRSAARFRLRYAVAAVDLGGHLQWGRQLPFDAANDYTNATATPHEWDEASNRAYLRSFVAMLSRGGIEEYDWEGRTKRTDAQTYFLGRGTPNGAGDGKANNLLTGFAAGPQVLPYSNLDLWIDPAYAAFQTNVNVIATARGGAMSWWQAGQVTTADANMGWLGEWTMSPFGRTSAYAAAPTQYWHSKVDTPWRINLLTAPAATIKYMLYGYMPQVIFRLPVSSIKEYAWAGFVAGANWWDPLQPKWNAAGVDVPGSPFNPLRASGLNSPGPDLQDDLFSPPKLFGAKPFAGFTNPNFSLTLSAGNKDTYYATAYPGPPDDWEDYAETELDASKTARTGSDPTAVIHKLMLGTRVNAWHLPDSPPQWTVATVYAIGAVVKNGSNYYTCTNSGTSAALPATGPSGTSTGIADGTCTWSYLDSSLDWKPPESPTDLPELTRPSILCPGISWFGNPNNLSEPDWTMKKYYSALPGDPMRGSMAMFSHDLNWNGTQSVIGGLKTQTNFDSNRGFFHRDSYWLDILNATAEAITLAKALHQDATCVGAVSIPTYISTSSPAGTAPVKPTHIRDVDRLMLSVLGEWFPGDATKPGSSTTVKPAHILTMIGSGAESKAKSPRYIFDWLASANICGVKAFLADPAGPALAADAAARKAANMERVLNDWRMSFFGANPTYSDFVGIDFDGDGYAVASFYNTKHPTLKSTHSPARDIPASLATDGVGAAPDLHFSLTGYFVFDRVRYVRALVRGQVWDELRRQAVDEANLETVFTIDPDGNYNATTKAGLEDSCTLYQRWITNHYAGESQRSAE